MSVTLEDAEASARFRSICNSNDTKLLQKLIDAGQFDIRSKICIDFHYGTRWNIAYSPWFAAVLMESLPVFRLLLENGLTIERREYSCNLSNLLADWCCGPLRLLLDIGNELSLMSEEMYTHIYTIAYCRAFFNPSNRLWNDLAADYGRKPYDMKGTVALIAEKAVELPENEADPDSVNYHKVFRMYIAVLRNDVGRVAELLTEADLSYFEFIHAIYRPAMLACDTYNLDMIKLFVGKRLLSVEKVLLKCIRGTSEEVINYCFQSGVDLYKQDVHGYILVRDMALSCKRFLSLMRREVNPAMKRFAHHHLKRLHCPNRANCKVGRYMQKLALIYPKHRKNLTTKIPGHEVQELTNQEVYECEAELKTFREMQISAAYRAQRSQTLFDFLSFEPRKLVRYARNMVIRGLYEEGDSDFENLFEHYGHILNRQWRFAQRRRRLIDSARDVLHCASGYSYIPEELTNETFKYLTDLELERLQKSSAEIEII